LFFSSPSQSPFVCSVTFRTGKTANEEISGKSSVWAAAGIPIKMKTPCRCQCDVCGHSQRFQPDLILSSGCHQNAGTFRMIALRLAGNPRRDITKGNQSAACGAVSVCSRPSVIATPVS